MWAGRQICSRCEDDPIARYHTEHNKHDGSVHVLSVGVKLLVPQHARRKQHGLKVFADKSKRPVASYLSTVYTHK
jgi:hypothetical protein